MIISRNTLGHLEVPDFVLMKASGERVGVLKCTQKSYKEKYNDLNELSFEIPYMADSKKTLYYQDIDVMKYIYAPSVGVFAIKDIDIINEGQHTEYKKVTCMSLECELGQKYLEEFSINVGLTGSIDGVKFYQPADQAHSLLHLCVAEKCPSWGFNYISPSLQTKQRSFEVSRQDIYSFLTNDVAQAFECVFVFDTVSKTISAYLEDEFSEDTNIHVSYNNLLEKAEMDYSIDDIKTCLTLKGSDDLDVREVAMGYDRIYDFSAYASTEYWSQSLLDAYNAWMELMDTEVDTSLFTYKTGVIVASELSGKTYEEAFTYLLSKYQNYYEQIGGWQSTKLPYLVNTRRNPGYGTISFTEDGSDAVTFERQTATSVVTSLPSSKNGNTLYIIKDSPTYAMYRWDGTNWVNVNAWHDIALAELKTLQASAEKLKAVAMKAGYGETSSARYNDTYLPDYYMYNALAAQIKVVEQTIKDLETDQAIIETDKNIISNLTAMRNNFTQAQLKELSAFIREDELTADNFVVTDIMTEEERFDMLYELLAYGEKELAKVATPQIQFSADLLNLYALPEFDVYSGSFDIGNCIWVTLRDDYSVRVKILEISVDYLDRSSLSVTFGNVMKKAKNMFTDVTDALNAATSAATSVSFGASYWSAAAEETDSIGKALADGLLGQKYYLSNAEDNETLINDNGIWITTTTGIHGREETDMYDAIYIGGGRILYTSDGWKTVAMSVGRGTIQYPSIYNNQLIFTETSAFGVFADYVIAGYVGGSIIAGGDIYSTNYKTSSSVSSGNAGAHINLTDGTFEFNSKTTGKKRLVLSDNSLRVFGIIEATEGHIGCDDDGNGGFIIKSNKLYNNKATLTTNSSGVYLGTDGIALGGTTTYISGVTKSLFQVDSNGNLYAGNVNIKGSFDCGTVNGSRFHATGGEIVFYYNNTKIGQIVAESDQFDDWIIEEEELIEEDPLLEEDPLIEEDLIEETLLEESKASGSNRKGVVSTKGTRSTTSYNETCIRIESEGGLYLSSWNNDAYVAVHGKAYEYSKSKVYIYGSYGVFLKTSNGQNYGLRLTNDRFVISEPSVYFTLGGDPGFFVNTKYSGFEIVSQYCGQIDFTDSRYSRIEASSILRIKCDYLAIDNGGGYKDGYDGSVMVGGMSLNFTHGILTSYG